MTKQAIKSAILDYCKVLKDENFSKENLQTQVIKTAKVIDADPPVCYPILIFSLEFLPTAKLDGVPGIILEEFKRSIFACNKTIIENLYFRLRKFRILLVSLTILALYNEVIQDQVIQLAE